MTGPRTDRRLAAAAVSGPLAFTAAWWGLGALTPGYDQSSDSISAVAELGREHAGAMLAAFCWQGAAQLANAALLHRAGRRAVAAALLAAGTGTLAVAAFPLPGTVGPAWLGTAHVVAAVLAFTGLHVAALAGALDRALPPQLRAVAGAALALALPTTVWWLAHLAEGGPGVGYAEKAMTTVLLAATTALAAWAAPPRRVP